MTAIERPATVRARQVFSRSGVQVIFPVSKAPTFVDTRGGDQEPAGVRVVINSTSQKMTSTVAPAGGVCPRSNGGRPGNTNVLVVEDDQGVRETTVAILREEGYVVVQAADGVDALELLRGHDIDVLLLDLRLPRMDGAAVLEALDRPPTVVVVSGFESFEEAEMRRRFGSVLFDCLRKPVSPHRLMAATAAAADHALSVRDTGTGTGTSTGGTEVRDDPER